MNAANPAVLMSDVGTIELDEKRVWDLDGMRNRAGIEWKDEQNPEFVIGNAFVSATCDIVNRKPAQRQ